MGIIGGLIAVLLYECCVGLFWGELRAKKFPGHNGSNSSLLVGEYSGGRFYHNYNKISHMIVAGHTGYGKTNFLKVLIKQLLGDVILLDLKGGKDYDFNVTATDIESCERWLSWVHKELRERMNDRSGKKYRRIFVVIDEAAELLVPSYMSGRSEEAKVYQRCLWHCSEIARLGRSFKISLVWCTQYPVSDVLPRQIKQNAECRVVFRLPTGYASEVALDEVGAEELPWGVAGRCIYKLDRKYEVQIYESVNENDGEKGWFCENVKVGDSESSGSRSDYRFGEV